MNKKIVKVLLLIIACVFLYYGFKKMDLRIPKINLSSSISSITLPDWNETKILAEINTYRQEKGLGVLTLNDKLAKAARSRLSVLLEYDDSLGEFTGLSREKALEVVGYSYSWVGDLAVLDFFRSNDLMAYWETDSNAKKTLGEENLKEVGIAYIQDRETVSVYAILAAPRKASTATKTPVAPKATWGGPDLWAAVNKRRVELGVNPLRQKDELCTISAIRLNQILDLGELDGHAGFEPTLNREDLKWISEKYNISEFLVAGYETPEAAVAAWENTLGHRKLLAGGEYVWGCIYAQNRFGVAIAAY